MFDILVDCVHSCPVLCLCLHCLCVSLHNLLSMHSVVSLLGKPSLELHSLDILLGKPTTVYRGSKITDCNPSGVMHNLSDTFFCYLLVKWD